MKTNTKNPEQIIRGLLSQDLQERKTALKQLKQATQETARTALDPEQIIRQLLLEMGMPEHVKGHRYAVTALLTIIREPALQYAVTTRLYPMVAQLHGANPAQVERALRHAIELCIDRIDLELMSKYFGNTICARRGKPTNSEFLARVASLVRQQIRDAA